MKLIANTPVRHDGEDIGEGDPFDVESKKIAEALIASGAARKSGTKAPADGEVPQEELDGQPAGSAEGQNGKTGDPESNQGAAVVTTPGASDEDLKASGAAPAAKRSSRVVN